MAKFLIDANMPYYLGIWSGDDYLHVRNINDEWPDSEIWEFARRNNLTIITKDADFSNRSMTTVPPPKVIHFKTGNMRIRALKNFLKQNWNDVLSLNKDHKLVNVGLNRMTAIE